MILFDYIKQIPPFITYEVYDHLFGAYFNNSAIFQGWGIHLYTGKFGTGKTSTLAQIAYNYCVRYPQLSILTNINLQNFPEWTNIYKLNSAQDILHAPKNCIVVIDEIGTIFNSRDFSGGKRAVPKPLFQHLCQCRKRKMMILATVQRFNLLDKQIRDITATVSTCRATFRHPYTRLIKVKTYDIDEYEAYTENKSYMPKKLYSRLYLQTNQSRQLYDTSQLVDNMLDKEYISDTEILANRGVDVTSDIMHDRKTSRSLRKRRGVFFMPGNIGSGGSGQHARIFHIRRAAGHPCGRCARQFSEYAAGPCLPEERPWTSAAQSSGRSCPERGMRPAARYVGAMGFSPAHRPQDS